MIYVSMKKKEETIDAVYALRIKYKNKEVNIYILKGKKK